MSDDGNSFPKSDLTNRLYSTHRPDVHGALTKDSPAAAQAYATRRKQQQQQQRQLRSKKNQQQHPLSRSMPSSHRSSMSNTRPPKLQPANGIEEEEEDRKKEESTFSSSSTNPSLLQSASTKVIFNSTLPPRPNHLRGHAKKAWATPQRAGAAGAAGAEAFFGESSSTTSLLLPSMTASSKMETSKYEEDNNDSVLIRKQRPPTFTESLQLDEHYLEEFLGGNFVYLRPKIGLQRTAYDLECVEHFETNPHDYYTMSREGITHFGRDESEFTPLDQWEQEYAMFHQIREIVFFRRYRLWKSFMMWMKSYRRRKMNVAAKEIQSRLPMFTPALQHTHLQIVHLCHDVSEWRLFKLDPTQCLSLEDFTAAQALQRTQISDWLMGFSDDIRLLVRNACDDVLDAFLETNEIQAEHRMTFMEKAALRTECSRLVKYIRVVDILVTGILRQLALESLQAFCEHVSSNCR